MSSKPEATPPAPAPAPAGAPEAAPAPSKIAGLLPVILVVVLAPVVSWAVAQFVILPQFEKKLNAAVAASNAEKGEGEAGGEGHAAAAEESHGGGEKAASGGEHGGKEGGKKGEGAAGPVNTYDFTNIVVNLAGTMGTRYLKTTFMVQGKEGLREAFSMKKAEMQDITINVLSSFTLADLEEPGAKNIIREKLVNAYNQAFGKKLCTQVFFSDFVVQ